MSNVPICHNPDHDFDNGHGHFPTVPDVFNCPLPNCWLKSKFLHDDDDLVLKNNSQTGKKDLKSKSNIGEVRNYCLSYACEDGEG